MSNLGLVMGLWGALRLFGFFTDPLLSSAEIHRVVGEPARTDRARPAAEQLKVITWNIEQGSEYESVLQVLRGLDADVLLLQEVDRGCSRTGFRNVARDLAHALDMNWVAAGEFQEIGEGRNHEAAITGQAILSKFPIEEADAFPFRSQDRWRWSVNPVQPRRGGRIALRARSAGLLLYNTHIESGGNDPLQRRQMAEIVADEAKRNREHLPVLIGGDFNNGPIQRASMFRSLSAAAFADALGATDQRPPTSMGQTHPIDWIFVKNVRPLQGGVVDARTASDHSPVFAALAAASSLFATR